jgi:hypothetical protein
MLALFRDRNVIDKGRIRLSPSFAANDGMTISEVAKSGALFAKRCICSGLHAPNMRGAVWRTGAPIASNGRRFEPPPLMHTLFADAESSEDTCEHVLGRRFTCDLAEIAKGIVQPDERNFLTRIGI